MNRLNAILKTVPKTINAVANYSHDKDALEAWNEFSYTNIPKKGHTPNEQLNLYFEYIPESKNGDF